MNHIIENNDIVQKLYKQLISEIKSYRPTTSLEMVEKAFQFAHEAHKHQQRQSGEPYIIHPLSVAIILAEIRTDLESIVAGLLHDVVEDTIFSMIDITTMFGEEVALLVDGVTKIEQVEYVSKTDEQAENYRKMFFHMSQDVRVLLIKIADRLHNMRTLSFKKVEKQVENARETLDIYAPLAHRLGIAKLRYELEDLGFRYADRETYYDLARRVKLKQAERQKLVERLIREVKERLDTDGIEATMDGRPKRFYSVYKKMISKNKTLDQIYDLYAVRVLVNTVQECYEVLGRLHEMYTPVHGRFKDYIGMKKSNGYQSLHTSLMSEGEIFEVQIRTYEMHSVAEFGIAAHWKYKESDKAAKDKWLQEIMDWQRDISNQDFLEALKMDLSAFQSHVYCFTPQGEVISLAHGANVIDFAYAIHSAVGNRMIGARVDGKMVSVDYVLKTGERVEIVTSQNAKGPNRDWLKIIKTNQARSKISQWFNRESREENIIKGRELLELSAKNVNVPLDELFADKRDLDVLGRFNCKTLEQLYLMVGVGGLKEKMVVNHLLREYERMQPPPSDEELIQNLLDTSKKETRKQRSGIVIKGIGDTDVRFGKCCGPLPGDEIIGFVTRGRGLTIHRTDCVNITAMDELERRRLLDAQWQVPDKDKKSNTYHTDLRIVCEDRDGLLANITSIFADERVKVTSLTALTTQSEAIFTVGMEIYDVDHLDHITKRLIRETGAHEISRVHS